MKEDFKEIEEQLSKRAGDRLQAYFSDDQVEHLFLLAKSDIGVCRNGGRRGTRYAAQNIMNCLKKMQVQNGESLSLKEKTVITDRDAHDFNRLQEKEIENITQGLAESSKNIIHFGGGHDHVYPLLKSIEKESRKILVINIDAHLDTRTDELYHSGTPFRQFANETTGEFKLIQLGIHDFANAKSNYQKLKTGEMDIYGLDQMREWTKSFTQNISPKLDELTENFRDYTVVLSLDCDALSSDIMSGVSAVNHKGIPANCVEQIFTWYKELKQERKYLGIYEYNPLFDDLSQKGARYLSALIYAFLF
ncbi:arginase family protein [Halobacteriovorax sp. GB3]|uniref:arginase family protein n=1 Tax=Halobacteriovorax sp. GB3 TaxID=2719615 RepID=UPI00235F230C|nr:arginase family protein [Halobacteriovorax sp. GB3]MDD0853376.1 arginase family protein [Halobacteriovorax sp. GB3]